MDPHFPKKFILLRKRLAILRTFSQMGLDLATKNELSQLPNNFSIFSSRVTVNKNGYGD